MNDYPDEVHANCEHNKYRTFCISCLGNESSIKLANTSLFIPSKMVMLTRINGTEATEEIGASVLEIEAYGFHSTARIGKETKTIQRRISSEWSLLRKSCTLHPPNAGWSFSCDACTLLPRRARRNVLIFSLIPFPLFMMYRLAASSG